MSSATPALSRPRMDMLDVVRLLASFAVILIHSVAIIKLIAPNNADRIVVWGRFAVPFFTAAAVGLTADTFRRDPTRSLVSSAGSRFLRIYVPFLIWTVLYLILRDAKFHFISHKHLLKLNADVLVVGTVHHLWFLPFILTATIFTSVLTKFVLRKAPTLLVVSLCLIAAVAISITPNPFSHSDVQTATQPDKEDEINVLYTLNLAYNALPSVPVGIAFGMVWQQLRSSHHRKKIALLGAAVTIASLASLSFAPYGSFVENQSNLFENLSGAAALLLAFGPWSGPLVRLLASWGQSAYGIYLVHIAWVLGLEFLLNKCHEKYHLPYNLLTIPGTILLVIVLSTLSAVILGRYKFTAWTIGSVAPARKTKPQS